MQGADCANLPVLDDDPPPGVVLHHSVFGTVFKHKHRIKHRNKGYGTVRGLAENGKCPPRAWKRFPPPAR